MMADAVYLGIWQNASRPGLEGAMLTLSDTQGRILVSIITILVTVAGGYLWTLLCLAIYRYLLARQTVDGLDLQQQVAIRNSTRAAFSSATELIKIWWAWRRSKGSIKRTALPLILAIVSWAVIFAAGVLISLVISSSPEDQVLVLKKQTSRCGVLDFGQLDPSVIDSEMSHIMLLKLGRDIDRAHQLAIGLEQQKYSSGFAVNRLTFPAAGLPSTLTTNVPCPAANASRCKLGPSGAASLTTGPMDSFAMFGINTSPADRVTYERQVACSPIDLSGMVQHVKYSDVPYFIVDLGSEEYFFPKATIPSGGYHTFVITHTPDYIWDVKMWDPSPELKRSDADVSAVLLNSNGIYYTDKVSDPFFSATVSTGQRNLSVGTGFEEVSFYLSTEWVQTMFCAEQHVICNSVKNLCSPPLGITQLSRMLNSTDLGFTARQRLIATRIGRAAADSSFNILSYLGGRALLASQIVLQGSLSGALPDDQWQREIEFWFRTALVKMQFDVQEYADNPGAAEYSTQLLPGSKGYSYVERGTKSDFDAFIAAGEEQCGQQLMQSTSGVVNFSMLYLVIVLVVTVAVCLLGCILEPALNVLIRRCYGWNSVWRKARVADNKMHLLRMAIDDGGNAGIQWDSGKGETGLPVAVGLPALWRPEHQGNSVSYRRVYQSVPMGDPSLQQQQQQYQQQQYQQQYMQPQPYGPVPGYTTYNNGYGPYYQQSK